MRKLSKQVLALGLASGVLLSGLPLGNVVDAASKPAVTKVAKAELTLGQKVAVERTKFLANKTEFNKEVSKFTTGYYESLKVIIDLDHDYDYNELTQLYKLKRVEIEKVRASQMKVVGADYDLIFRYEEGSDSDEKKLTEYTNRNKAYVKLNVKKSYAPFIVVSAKAVKDVSDLKKYSEATAVKGRLKFEALNTLGTQLLKKNQAWEKSINIGNVTEQFKKDLIAAGKKPDVAAELARKLDNKLVQAFVYYTNSHNLSYGNYVRTFNYDVSKYTNLSTTLRALDILNGKYKENQDSLSSKVADAYVANGLKPVSGAFNLK